MKNLIRIIIQVIIGVLFVLSGVFKAFDSQGFMILTRTYGLNDFLSHLMPLISGIEVILGLCIILNIKPKLTTLIIGTLTILITIAFGYAYFVKGIDDSACMGPVLSIPPYLSFTRNFFIIGGCIWLWIYGIDDEPKAVNWKKWIVYILSGLTFTLSGYTVGVKIVNKNSFKIGEQASSTFLRYYGDRISSGKSIVFIFSPDCSHCWNMTENVKSIKQIPEYNNLFGLTYNNVDTAKYMQEMKPNFDVYKYPTSELYDKVSESPTLLILENGKITYIFRINDIPCGQILLKIEHGGGL